MSRLKKILLTEEEEIRFDIVKKEFEDKFGKQTNTSVLRLLINEKYKGLIED